MIVDDSQLQIIKNIDGMFKWRSDCAVSDVKLQHPTKRRVKTFARQAPSVRHRRSSEQIQTDRYKDSSQDIQKFISEPGPVPKAPSGRAIPGLMSLPILDRDILKTRLSGLRPAEETRRKIPKLKDIDWNKIAKVPSEDEDYDIIGKINQLVHMKLNFS